MRPASPRTLAALTVAGLLGVAGAIALVVIAEAPGIATALQVVAGAGLIVAAAGIAVLLVQRWRASSGAQRRVVAPVLWTGAALVASVSLLALLQVTDAPTAAHSVMSVVSAVTIVAVPFAFLAGLLRMRYTRADIVGGLVDRLHSSGSGIREAIAAAIEDPSLELVYWRARARQRATAGRTAGPRRGARSVAIARTRRRAERAPTGRSNGS